MVVKTQEQVPTTVSNPDSGQMTQLLQLGKVQESTDPTKSLGGSVLHFCVIGWAAFRDIAVLSAGMSGFLKSTCLGFIDHKNLNLGLRPDLDKATPTLSKLSLGNPVDLRGTSL